MRVTLKIFREGLGVHMIGVAGGLAAGVTLLSMSNTFAIIPGLALLLPATLGARGTIHGALGSKLSSMMHLGLIKDFSFRNRTIRENIDNTHKATLFVSFLLSFIAFALAKFSGIPANFFLLFFISVVSGTVAGIVLIVITNVIAFQAFKRGWDPDNVTAPLIATLGDFITVPILFFSASIALHLPQFLLVLLFLCLTAYILYETRGQFTSPRFLILFISITIQTFAGIFLEHAIPRFLKVPGLLAFLPAFLSAGGNLSSFIASRLSTQLHLGILPPKFMLKGGVINEMLNVALLSIFIFPLLGFVGFALQGVVGISQSSILEIVRITLLAGFLNTLIVAIALSFVFSILSWRLNLDPDDVTIPPLSAIADFFGIVFLLLVI